MLLVTIADDRAGRKGGKYTETQNNIRRFFEGNKFFGIDRFLMWTTSDIISHPDYEKYKDMLDVMDPAINPRMYKPMLLKAGLDMIEHGEFLVYNDTSPEMWINIGSRIDPNKYDLKVLEDMCVSNGGILTSHGRWDHDGTTAIHVGPGCAGHHTHENFTSDECMEIMGLTKYKHSLQHTSGFIVLKKCTKAIKFVDDWLRYNGIRGCAMSLDYAKDGKIGHRHDQSVSGLLINQMNNKLVEKLNGDEQHMPLNPNNLLNYCQIGTKFRFIYSNTQLSDKKFRRPPDGMILTKRNYKLMKLHLGCAEKHLEGYTNVDVRDLPGVDLVENIMTLDSIKDSTVDLIYASHVLEHVGRREYMDVLRRWFAVLKEGGVLRIAVPDFETVVEHYNENKDLSVLRGFLYGGQTYVQNYHYCAWDFETLKNDLLEVGFKIAERYDWRDTDHSHMDDFSQCYLPHMDKENGKLMSLNVEATK